MKSNYLIFFFLIIFFNNTSFSYSENVISYIDLDKILKNSIVGKKLINEIQNKNDDLLKKFQNEENKLKEKEAKIISQKNLLNDEEYQKKVNNFKEQVDVYSQTKEKAFNDLNKNRIESTKIILNEINSILASYSKKNSIDIILQKQNIIIGKSSLDITDSILAIVDEKIKKLN